VTSFTDSHDNI